MEIKARSDGQPRTATSTLTQLLNYEVLKRAENSAIYNMYNIISDHQSIKRPGGAMGGGANSSIMQGPVTVCVG